MNIRIISERIEAIHQNQEMGATQLAREAVRLLGEIAEDPEIPISLFPELLAGASRDLARARPSMASIYNAVGSLVAAWLESGGESNVAAARAAVAEAARRWIARQEAAAGVIADHAAEVIGGTVITLSFSSTVLRTLEECWSRDLLEEVIVAESRPLCEGRRTAETLGSRGIPTTLITDAQMGLFAAEARAAVVGADTIRPNGSLTNKSGTLLLALAARRCRVPFYALAETHKIAPNVGPFRTPTLEEKDPRELLAEPLPGVTVRNIYFDLTPARYITGYITEAGVLNRQEVASLAQKAPGAILAAQ